MIRSKLVRRRVAVASIAFTVVAGVSLALVVPGASFAANPLVSVDLSYNLGAVTHAASGSLYGLSTDGTPPASDLAGLNMQSIGQMAPDGTQHPTGDALKVGPEFFGAGGKTVQIYMQDFYPTWPYTKVSMADYATVVTTQVNKVKAASNAGQYVFVPFNEPDWIWYGNSGTKLTQFENDWKTIYQTIRTANPSALIAGPNFEEYNDAAYKSFLTFAKANNVLPNVITWHELSSSFLPHWYDHYNQYRADETAVGVSPIPININEYGQTAEMGVPGKMIQYLARFDATRVAGNMSSWFADEYLGRLLNASGQRTSGWYLYYWYGQASGNSARVTPPSGTGPLQALASIASDKKSARVVIGGSTGSNDIKFAGLSSTNLRANGNTNVRVTISTLVNSGDSSSSGPTVTSAAHYVTISSDGTLTVTVPNMSTNNVYLVQLG